MIPRQVADDHIKKKEFIWSPQSWTAEKPSLRIPNRRAESQLVRPMLGTIDEGVETAGRSKDREQVLMEAQEEDIMQGRRPLVKKSVSQLSSQ